MKGRLDSLPVHRPRKQKLKRSDRGAILTSASIVDGFGLVRVGQEFGLEPLL